MQNNQSCRPPASLHVAAASCSALLWLGRRGGAAALTECRLSRVQPESLQRAIFALRWSHFTRCVEKGVDARGITLAHAHTNDTQREAPQTYHVDHDLLAGLLAHGDKLFRLHGTVGEGDCICSNVERWDLCAPRESGEGERRDTHAQTTHNGPDTNTQHEEEAQTTGAQAQRAEGRSERQQNGRQKNHKTHRRTKRAKGRHRGVGQRTDRQESSQYRQAMLRTRQSTDGSWLLQWSAKRCRRPSSSMLLRWLEFERV